MGAKTPEEELIEISDPASGLEAVIAIDSTALGPAAGGVRTRAYPDRAAMIADARELARAMTIKCALAGLAAGGAKAVVRDHRRLDRPRAFRRLGAEVARLGGRFRTAGDLGTTRADLEAMAEVCPDFVHVEVASLAASVARGLAACLEACRGPIDGATVAIQGCGAIGSAVAAELARRGASLVLADLDGSRVERLAGELGARVLDPAAILSAPVDILSPCAGGRVIDAPVAGSLRAHVICGGANNVFVSEDAEAAVVARGLLAIPDVVASAGAVVDGIGETIMGLADRGPLIDALGATAASIVEEARRTGALPSRMAVARARDVIARRGVAILHLD